MESDKFFWHRYDFLYDIILQMNFKNIIEIGVAQGASISWLKRKYPEAKIIGADILSPMESWPIDNNISYVQLDQASDVQVQTFFSNNTADLIIEDGSHIPSHQLRCLKYGFLALKSGGILCIEDIHTSLPEHSLYKKENSFLGFVKKVPTALSTLLSMERYKKLRKVNLSSQEAENISSECLSVEDIQCMYKDIDKIFFYKRATFPLKCYACNGDIFLVHNYVCKCGAKLYEYADSMTCAIFKK